MTTHPRSTILVLMFHRVNDPHSQCDPEQFALFIDYLTQHFPIVSPDQPYHGEKVAIMLTFDDAYFDFYHHVFPLLQHHCIPALLAVPTQYIMESTTLSAATRLSVPYPEGMENNLHQTHVPFCTWQEIREMANTPYVIIASHSASHANLTSHDVDLHQEVCISKSILEKKLNQKIRYFVYPYGKMNTRVHQYVLKHYDYGIRIGGATNRGWDRTRGQLYRIDADHLWKSLRPIDKPLLRRLAWKYWMNRLRKK